MFSEGHHEKFLVVKSGHSVSMHTSNSLATTNGRSDQLFRKRENFEGNEWDRRKGQ